MAKSVISKVTDPYMNLALETYLYSNFDGEPTLYLWQNKKTVVIGKWQNAYKEVNFARAKESGIRIARRTTGGGAVYHDLGNLNFTFILSPDDYDTKKQLGVIANAVAAFGISADISGRNDLTVNGLKFSGNAFKFGKSAKLHHGTLLVDENTDIMSKVLNPSPLKLRAKGVDSVKSRVVNLRELNSDVTVEQLKNAITESFEKVYGSAKEVSVPESEFRELTDLYSSEKWILDSNPDFDLEVEGRLSFGELSIGLSIADGVIKKIKAYSDSLDIDVPPAVENALIGTRFQKNYIETALKPLNPYADEIVNLMSDVLP